MVRPFTLRDLTLVRRLSECGVSLHAETALADNLHPLRGALLSMVVGGEFPTFVLKAEQRDSDGFIQLLLKENTNHANILYVSPTIRESETNGNLTHGLGAPSDGDVWLSLLDQAVIEAGQQGAHSLVAEVDETGPELPILRRAGFAVYTRQDIWVRDAEQERPLRSLPETKQLRQRTAEDDWDIQLLYANTVPRLVQLVEPIPPLTGGDAWVLREEGELQAYVHIHEGALATWLRFFIHPGAEADAEAIVAAALQIKSSRAKRPVYCCVRRYEGWLPTSLERGGFRFWGSQAVMVKHTVQHLQAPMPKLAAVLDKQGMPVSTPYVQQYHSDED